MTYSVKKFMPKGVAEDSDAAEESCPTSWTVTRIFGGAIFAVSMFLIIYGLSLGRPNAALEKMAKGSVAVMELTAKPRDEVRTFEYAMLPNGVQAVTVRDKRALQQAFAAAVEAGSFDNPVNMPGLAHFCEHMVFLGTEKYKTSNGFDNFIAAHGGSDNAYTSEELTVYYAQVSQDAAREGIDRFADFLRAPLFSEKYVDKEVQAVDSEFKKDIQDRYRQVMAVFHSLAVKESPVSRFSTGNIQTLKTDPENASPPIDPVKALREYWETHYCPDRIKVVSVASDSNAEQLKRVEKEFGDLKPQSKACEAPRPKFNLPKPYPAQSLQKFVNIEGMQPRSFIWLQWPLPDVTSKYASAPLDYIKYVIMYGGENSLIRILKDVLNLASGVEIIFDASSAGTEVVLELQLTEQGRENIELILDVIFAYLARLQRDGVHEGLYNSLAEAWRLRWDWGGQEKPADTARKLAARLTYVKPKELLWAEALVEKPDRELIRQLLAKMTPTNMNVALMNRATKEQAWLEELFEGQDVKTLPHYGIKYTVQKLNDALAAGSVEKWEDWLGGNITATSIEKAITDTIERTKVEVIPDKVPVPKAPRTIEGIPETVSIAHMHAAVAPFSSELPIDTLLYGPTPVALSAPSTSAFGKESDIWYRGGWMMASPMVQVHLSLKPLKKPEDAEMTPLENLQLELYGRLLSDVLSPKLFEYTVVGMSYKIDVAVESDGLDFSFAGLQPNLPALLKRVVQEFNTFNHHPEMTPKLRWTRILNQLREDLTSYPDMPLNYAIADRNLILTKGSHSRAEILEVLDEKKATLESSSKSVSELLLSKQLRLTALTMGNLGEKDAKSLVGDFVQSIALPQKVAAEQPSDSAVERVKPIVNLRKPIEVRKLNPREGDKNDVVVVSVVAGVSTVEQRVLLGLLGSLFRPMAYNYLRTESQLGYVVTAGVVLLSNVQLMSCVVQGDKVGADAMEAAVHHLSLDLMPKRLQELSEEEFNAFKDAFRHHLLQPPMALKDEFQHFKGPVNQGGIGFDLVNEMLRYLDGPLATKEALQAEWQKLMFPQEGERSMVVVKYFAQANMTSPRTSEQATQTWVAQNVSENAQTLLGREFKQVHQLSKVDSAERQKLAQSDGWFPMDQHLKLEDETKSASKEPVEVPQQLQDLANARKEEIHSFMTNSMEYSPSFHAHKHVLRGFQKNRAHASYPRVSIAHTMEVDA